MPTYQADAIVLRRLDYGETDRIVTLLTREHGKLAAIAKGARKGKSKAGPSLDLFARSTMMLAKGKNLDVVAQVQRHGDARYIAGDLQRTAYASLVVEIVDKVVEDRHPVDEIFELVVETLQRLNVVSRAPQADTAWFLMRMLEVLGYQPQLQHCPGCGATLPEAPGWFSPLLGGVLCSRCSNHDQGGSPISVNGLKMLRLMAAGQAELYDRVRLSMQLLDEVEQALYGQLEYHLDRHLKSIDFIRSIRRTPHPTPPPQGGREEFGLPEAGSEIAGTPHPDPPPQGGREI